MTVFEMIQFLCLYNPNANIKFAFNGELHNEDNKITYNDEIDMDCVTNITKNSITIKFTN